MNKTNVTAIGFLVANVIPAIFMCVYWQPKKIYDIIISFLGFYLFSGLMVISIGIPTFLIIKYFWRISLHSSLIAGLIDGLIVAIIFFRIGFNDINLALMYSSLGALTAFVFWLIWKRGNS
jgi:uncharacterized membrane protein